jgi:hypothetical protein
MTNIDNPHGFKYEYRKGGGTAPLEEFWTNSNTTLAKGDPVRLSTTGYVSIAAATTTITLLGVAAHAVTGATGIRKKVLVIPGYEDVVFSGQCSGAPTQAHIGSLVDLEGSTGIFEINEDATTTKAIRLLNFKPGTTIETNAEMYFNFNENCWGGSPGAIL